MCDSGDGEINMHRIPLRYDDFKSTFSVKASKASHASLLEMGALGISVQGLVRQTKWHGHRTFALLDSQALLYACKKGRSGARNFCYGSRRLGAMIVVSDIQLHHLGFTPPGPTLQIRRVVECGP
jgi:hypothetical protein